MSTPLIEDPQHSKRSTLCQGLPHKITLYHSGGPIAAEAEVRSRACASAVARAFRAAIHQGGRTFGPACDSPASLRTTTTRRYASTHVVAGHGRSLNPQAQRR